MRFSLHSAHKTLSQLSDVAKWKSIFLLPTLTRLETERNWQATDTPWTLFSVAHVKIRSVGESWKIDENEQNKHFILRLAAPCAKLWINLWLSCGEFDRHQINTYRHSDAGSELKISMKHVNHFMIIVRKWKKRWWWISLITPTNHSWTRIENASIYQHKTHKTLFLANDSIHPSNEKWWKHTHFTWEKFFSMLKREKSANVSIAPELLLVISQTISQTISQQISNLIIIRHIFFSASALN